MSSQPTPVDPDGLYRSPAFAQGMIAPAGPTLYVGGQNGVDADGTLLDGLEAQTEQALRTLLAVLAEAGTGPEPVVKLTISSPVKKIPKSKNGVQVRIHGKLSKARGGERVVVSYRENPSANWLFQEVAVASSGSFTVVARVKYGTTFVAQWAGDDRSRGAGSHALRIPGPPVPKKK